MRASGTGVVHNIGAFGGAGATAVIAAVLAVCGGLVAPAAAVTIQPTAQQRSVGAFVIVPPCGPPSSVSDSEQAADFGPFDASVHAERICDFAQGIASADQQSAIHSASIIAASSTSSQAASVNQAVIHAIPNSVCDVTFTLATPVRYAINGSLTAQGAAPVVLSYSRVRLIDAASAAVIQDHLVEPNAGGASNTLAVQDSGTLVPGSYRLLIDCAAVIDSIVPPNGSGTANYDITATFQRPGDADLNGVVDVNDLLAVIQAWHPCAPPCPPWSGCPADLNGDCTVDINDLLMVINNWG